MSLLDSIIDVQIQKPTGNIQVRDFGTLLIIGQSKDKPRVKLYKDILEIAKDYDDSSNEYKAAMLAFSQKSKLEKILIGQPQEDESCKDAYPLIASAISNNFYAVMITSKEEEDQLAIAELVEAGSNIFGISSNDKQILNSENTNNILHKLNALGRTRSFVIYNSNAATGVYPEAAWFGLMLTKPAGSSTWAYKSLSGFAADFLSGNEISTLDSKCGNYFVPLAGQNVMFTGKMAGGEWIDIVRGLDLVSNHLQTSVGNALIHSEKISYTNQGIAVIEATIRHALNDGVEMNIIDKDSITVSVPDVRKISASDKKNRLLNNVKFEAMLAGAIHTLKIQGSISI